MNKISNVLVKVKKKKNFEDLMDTNFLEFAVKNKIGIPKKFLSSLTNDYFGNHKYNPDPKGLIGARYAISNYYKEEGVILDSENIIVTASTSESYGQIFVNFTKPGQEVLFPNPCYPLFEYLAKYANITPKYYKLDENNNWEIDILNFEKLITRKTKGIVLISPNNPTGSILTMRQIEQIELIAKKNNMFIIFDEVFSEFIDLNALPRPHDNNGSNIFVLNGISKMLALPDLKLAWIGILGPDKNRSTNILETSNDTYLNANYLTQSILSEILPYRKTISKKLNSILNVNRSELKLFLNKHPKLFKGNIGNGGIHSVIKVNTEINEETIILKLLSERHLSVHPGYFYDIESSSKSVHIIISILKENSAFKKVLKLLAQI